MSGVHGGRLSRAMLLALTVVGLAGGCGGEDAGPRPEPKVCRDVLPLSDTPDFGSGPVDCSVLRGLELYVLDDFEPGSSRTGWYINNDRTALMNPMPDTDPIPTTEIPGGRCLDADPDTAPTTCSDPTTPRGECKGTLNLASQRAVRVHSGFLSNDGGVFARDLPKEGCVARDENDPDTHCRYLPGPPYVGPCSVGEVPSPGLLGCNAVYDFSDWDGVLIWARKAPGSQTNVRLRLSDVNTDEKSCRCNPYTSQNDTSDGCDKFGRHLSLSPDFQAFLLPFSEMQQAGWGMSSPALDTSEILSVGLEFGRGAWDFWIDDIAFYRSTR